MFLNAFRQLETLAQQAFSASLVDIYRAISRHLPCY